MLESLRTFHPEISLNTPVHYYHMLSFYITTKKTFFVRKSQWYFGQNTPGARKQLCTRSCVINTHTLFGVLPVYLLTAMQDASRLIDPRDPPRHQRVGATLYGQAQASACCLSFSTDCEHVTEQDTTGWASDTAGCWVSTSPSG